MMVRWRWLVWGWLGVVLVVCLCNSVAVLWFEWYGEDMLWAFLLPFVHTGVMIVLFMGWVMLGPGSAGRRFGARGTAGEEDASDVSDVSGRSDRSDLSGDGVGRRGLGIGDGKTPLISRLMFVCGFGYIGAAMVLGARWLRGRPAWWGMAGFVIAGFVLPILLYFVIWLCVYVFGGRERAAAFVRREAARMREDRARRRRMPRRLFRRRGEAASEERDGGMEAAVTLVAGSFLVTVIVWGFNLGVIFVRGGFGG